MANRLDKRKVIIGAARIGVGLRLAYANAHACKVLLYVAAAAAAVLVSLVGGLLNGLVAQLSEEETCGGLFDITQALTGLPNLVTTLVYGVLSLLPLSAPFYWFALRMAALAVFAMRLKPTHTEAPA